MKISRSFIGMKWRCAVPIGITLILAGAYGQVLPVRDLHRWNASAPQTIVVNRTVVSQIIARQDGTIDSSPQPTIIEFSPQTLVSGLAVEANLQLTRRDGLARIILIDDQSREFLVYEAYPLITPDVSTPGGVLSISAACQETCLLPNLHPASLRVEVVNATVALRAVDIIPPSTTSLSRLELDTKRAEIHAAQENEIVKVLNAQLRAAGLRWQAGTTLISHMTYAEKRRLFRPPTIPNLQGFEYYSNGIFEILNDSDTVPARITPQTSAFIPAFDWRSRHGANDLASPYYDPNGSGWITSVKTQLCSDCWAHAANGAVEAGVNLYFNQHLDLDLSEQQLVSCSGAGSCAYGGNPGAALAYIANKGVIDDACFPETGRDDACNMCTTPQQKIFIGGYQYIVPSDGTDNLKAHLINDGPFVFGISSWWHTMVLVGYDTDPTTLEPIWILKNSWGTGWGVNGYGSLKVNTSDIYLTYNLLPPVSSQLVTYDIACRDEDGDGFYNWGISATKPSSCPSNSPDINDCNDFDPSVALQQADGSCVTAPLPVLRASPTTLNFSPRPINTTSSAERIRLDNLGGAQIMFSDFQVVGDYAIQVNYCSSALNPGAYCDLDVVFSPTAIGNRSGQLTVISNAVNNPQSVSLNGRGVAPTPVPFISIPLVPSTVGPGSSSFSLRVNGTGFVFTSAVNWNGAPRSTTFVSNSQLSAAIPSSDVSSAKTAIITVSTPGGQTSNEVFFPVTKATSTTSFSRADFATGVQPESVVAADFNEDGKVDLALANYSGTVSILLGNGDGTFTPHTDYAAGAGARGIATGDFNGDGKLDLAVANQTASTVSIVLGNGDGTFQTNVDYATAAGPFCIAIGDFNGDGLPDIAVVDQNANAISILLGNGDGTFRTHVEYAVGQMPFGLALGDFNADGVPDIAVANFTNNTISILLGNGDGTFQTHTDYASSIGPELLATADLNNDGKLDIVAGTNPTTGVISVLIGNGDGSFQTHIDYSAGSRPRSVSIGDLNGDGKLDLAVSNYGSNNVSVLLGNGDGTFAAATNYPTASSPQAITVADFDNNGRLDLAIANYASNSVSVLSGIPGTAVGSVNPTALSFPGQLVGTTSAAKSVALSNSGNIQMTVSSVQVTGDFQIVTNYCMNGVKPGTHCNVSVSFTPTATGTRTGTLNFNDDATNTPQLVTLSGTGTSPTTTTLQSSLNPSGYNRAVTFTGTVVGTYSGTPTGTVTFYDGATAIGSSALSAGMASLITSSLSAGVHSITASYGGDAIFVGSTSAALTQTVNKASTTVVLTSGLNPSYVNEGVTFTAKVTGQYGGTPSGSVTFKQGTTLLGTVALTAGQATYTKTFTGAGSFPVTAAYAGDANYLSKTSAVLKQVVMKYSTTTSIASSLNPSIYGQAVTLTATVSTTAPVGATGTVLFKNGTTSIGSATLISGVARLTKTNLPAGSLSITATYKGDTTSAASTSPVLTQTVQKATTTTTLKSSLNPSVQGQTVTFTATVTSPTVKPTGTVTFLAGSTTLGTVALSSGKAAISRSTLPKGSTTIKATYNGTANIVGSTASLVQQVN